MSFDRNPIRTLDPAVLRHVRSFTDQIEAKVERGQGLWFYGDPGTGKTSLAMLVAGQALRAGASVAVYSVPRLLVDLSSTYRPDSSESFMDLFSRLTSVDMLVLDDLGTHRKTEWVEEQLFSVVNERWQDEASVIVTSNTPPADAGDALTALRETAKSLRAEQKRHTSLDQLARLADRVEKLTRELQELEIGSRDPFRLIRAQLGERTVSRLAELCGDPIPIMGPDLRLSTAPTEHP